MDNDGLALLGWLTYVMESITVYNAVARHRRRQRQLNLLEQLLNLLTQQRTTRLCQYRPATFERWWVRMPPEQLPTLQLFTLTRLNTMQYKMLLHIVGPAVRRSTRVNGRPDTERSLTESIRLFICLRRLTHHVTYRELAYYCGIGVQTAFESVQSVAICIRALLRNVLIVPQSRPNLVATERIVFMSRKIPNCVYFTDGSVCPRTSVPGRSKADYFDRFHKTSIKIQVTNSSHCLITHALVGAPGKRHDATMYATSTFGVDNESGLLTAKLRTDLAGRLFNPFNLSDTAYTNTARCMVPRKAPHDIEAERRFAGLTSKCRSSANEATFGKVKSRFRYALQRVHDDLPSHINLLDTVLILHNFLTVTTSRDSFDAFMSSNAENIDQANEDPLLYTAEELRQCLFNAMNIN